jgi:DNA modification methylase
MAVLDQCLTDHYAAYLGDCCEVMPTLPDASVHLSLYSPPFAGLYNYSSSDRDLSNARTYREFMKHYAFVVRECYRLALPGRVTAVHCMDVPRNGANLDGGRLDFPGAIIRLHERIGWSYVARYHVWKEPFRVRMRTLAKGLAHRQIVEDSTLCDVAHADYLLVFRKPGRNETPVTHPRGFLSYAGARRIPPEIVPYRGWTGHHTENRYSHWIWRQYASAFWDDVRIDRVLPFEQAKDPEDERHIHPLQLDVIDRCLALWTNPDEVVLTPFMGVGSEVYGALRMGRRAIGIELKPTYYRQALRNLDIAIEQGVGGDTLELFEGHPTAEEVAAESDPVREQFSQSGRWLSKHRGARKS